MIPQLLSSLAALLLLGEASIADDLAERRSVASPDRQFSVVFSDRQTFTVQDAGGAAVIASRDLTRVRDVAVFRPEHVLWSPDSQALAIAGGGGHDLETFILVRRGNSFVPVTVPNLADRYDNPAITPVKWIKGRKLVLSISGPHAGKASYYYYKGRATIRVSISPPACEVLYNRITEHNTDRDDSL